MAQYQYYMYSATNGTIDGPPTLVTVDAGDTNIDVDEQLTVSGLALPVQVTGIWQGDHPSNGVNTGDIWVRNADNPNGTAIFFSSEPNLALNADVNGPHANFTNQAGQSVPATCFFPGTLIRTDRGDVAVENLAIGDQLVTVERDLVPVKWVGRQTVRRLFAPRETSYPICIKAGALAENVPSRDLYVSPDHAMLVDGLLVNASALVNDTSIVQVAEVAETFTYFHIETEGHRNILAEGAAAETFVDNVTRRRFDNYAEYEALYPDAAAIIEQTCPRVTARRLLPRRIAARLTFRANALGHAVEKVA